LWSLWRKAVMAYRERNYQLHKGSLYALIKKVSINLHYTVRIKQIASL
jgi:hypothetical protein